MRTAPYRANCWPIYRRLRLVFESVIQSSDLRAFRRRRGSWIISDLTHRLKIIDYSANAYTMGVEKEVIQAGDGESFPKAGDMLTMHYTGTLANGGQQFDSSVSRGKPFQFVIGIGQVIRGWDEGVQKMSLGEKATLKISSDYGYGARGAPGAIPPHADLVFEVELLAIGDHKAPGFTGSSSSGCTIQ